MRSLIQVLRWGVALLLANCGLWTLNLAFFHGWASDVPPHHRGEWHRWWCSIFFIVGSVCLVAAALTIWLLGRWGHERLSPPGDCQKCGYNLTGNKSGVCPECGERI